MVEIAGGKILRVEEAGLPAGTSITVRDLFFNVPARRKFLRSESTELAQIASLVTHYALAHPDKHFELHSSANAMLIAAPVGSHQERIYQVFGRETLDQLLPLAAMLPLARVGLPQPPPWAKRDEDEHAGKVRAGRGAAARVRIQAGNSEAEPEFDVRVRQRAADPRQAGAARADRVVPQYPAADGVPGRPAVPGIAEHRGGRERAPIQSGSAVPAGVGGARLCARLGASGADEGAPGAAVHPRDHGAADGVGGTVTCVARVFDP